MVFECILIIPESIETLERELELLLEASWAQVCETRIWNHMVETMRLID